MAAALGTTVTEPAATPAAMTALVVTSVVSAVTAVVLAAMEAVAADTVAVKATPDGLERRVVELNQTISV